MANDLKSMLITDIVLNADNPREITPEKQELLVESVLSFPKMLAIRPVVLDASTHVVYGGNMRTRALLLIKDMPQQDIKAHLEKQTTYQRKTQFEKDELLDYWAKWQAKPLVRVLPVSNLTEAEQAEFIIKDNVGFGKWEYDQLANNWDNDILAEWGMDVWESSNADIDSFFQDKEDAGKEQGLHITIHVPKDMEADMDEIRQVVEAAVQEYTGVTVK